MATSQPRPDLPPRIGPCGVCRTPTRVSAESHHAGNQVRGSAAAAHLCGDCISRFGAAKARLMARARTDVTFARRCLANLSQAAQADLVVTCRFPPRRLALFGLLPGPRKCRPSEGSAGYHASS